MKAGVSQQRKRKQKQELRYWSKKLQLGCLFFIPLTGAQSSHNYVVLKRQVYASNPAK